MIVDWGKKGMNSKTAGLISYVRSRGLEMPIILLVRRKRFEDLPIDVLDNVDGYVFLAEETPEFIAKNLVSRLKQYAETMKTPFFGELVDYAEEGNQLWTCPGHNGGVFYSAAARSAGFSSNISAKRSFATISTIRCWSWATCSPTKGRRCARRRRRRKSSGPSAPISCSTAPRPPTRSCCRRSSAPGDLVLFDRNNHKAAHHGALMLGGGVPIYLETDRNAHGLIGPIDYEALDEKKIRRKIRDNPLVADKNAWKKRAALPRRGDRTMLL